MQKLLKKTLVFIMLVAMSTGLYGGCSDNNNSDRPTAVLNAMESVGIPAQVEMDGSESFAIEGSELISQTYTVIEMQTGETVFGPEVLTELLDQAIITTYIVPEDAPQDVNGVVLVTGDFLVTLEVEDSEGRTDTAEQVVSLSAEVLPGTSENCNATCSASSNEPDQVACTLNTGCSGIHIANNVLDPASSIKGAINDSTAMWIRACGAGGGKGTANIGGGGVAGTGGFAQTVTTVSAYQNTYGTSDMFYYIGKDGDHNDSGGSGGASTIVASTMPTQSAPWSLDQLVVMAGGGGGGGEGTTSVIANKGGKGGAGGFAYSDTVGDSDTGLGEDGASPSKGEGGGGTGCTEGIACGGQVVGGDLSGVQGKQGFGGVSGGSGSDSELGGSQPKAWINGTPDIGDIGSGGKGSTAASCDGGGGAGGFGGGGGAGTNSSNSACGGGGGGGSYASASTVSDSDAPDTNLCGKGLGFVVITFNLNPGN